MNSFTYEELEVGMSAEFSQVVTWDMMQKFREISNDENPLHTDENFAKGKGFPDRVVYGMLTASLYSRLCGVYIPGERCLLQSVHADFLHPVFIGDVLTVTGKIVEKNDSVKQTIIRAFIKNENDQKVSRAKIEAGVL